MIFICLIVDVFALLLVIEDVAPYFIFLRLANNVSSIFRIVSNSFME